jgi:hypothetical protein
MRPMVRIHDLSTNEIIDREMNDTEFADYQKEQKAIPFTAVKTAFIGVTF